ncbi:Arv1-domain-containing protein [Dendrothele bispora CBS 962.96]|uniref:Protein ARV n=1 Tax=Dendrothele bispora (strain CBS 962.96) TaxID=1314807 RepID=A0A4S8MS24_DENBC|nr:Arv1-domain-containing protein [Dendrothele bispora CBS 962.96]
MPICTTCTHWVPHLYTVYQSAHNLRLEQCTNCHAFADPYVEHDTLTLTIDLILLKRGVYRHLLYNRGTPPRRADSKGETEGLTPRRATTTSDDREWSRWALVLQLAKNLVFLDAFIRWSHLSMASHAGTSSDVSPWSLETIADFTRIFIGCLLETIAFHSGIILVSYVVLKAIDFIKSFSSNPSSKPSTIRREFRFSLIPLSLFYSSLTKLFLLFLLTVWRPLKTPPAAQSHDQYTHVPDLWTWNDTSILDALSFLNDDQLDRGWIVRNVLGGMSAGFGLRVILDLHPAFTTIIILFGWIAKTAVAELIGRWVAGDEKTGEVWLAYSIP